LPWQTELALAEIRGLHNLAHLTAENNTVILQEGLSPFSDGRHSLL
jgi:hypothetical protein